MGLNHGYQFVAEFNEEAKARGITKVVFKDYQYLDKFATEATQAVAEMIH